MGVKGSGHIKKVKIELAAAFEMVDMGPISFYLGLKVKRDRAKRTLKLSQPAYIDKILSKFHFDLAKPCNTPMKKGILLPNKGPEARQAERKQYQGMTGSLMFSMVETQPDIAHICCEPFCQESIPPTHRSRENNNAILQSHAYLRHNIRRR